MRHQAPSFRESLRSRSGKRRPKPNHRRLYLEPLEDRLVLANVSLSIPANLNAPQGGDFAVPVTVDQLSDGTGNTGMSQADFAIDYDPTVVSVSTPIFLGTAPVNAASLFTATPTFAPGQLEISLKSLASPIASVVGTAGGPITVTTVDPLPAALSDRITVTISGVTDFPAANGTFKISLVPDMPNEFTLNGTNSVGSGTVNTGTWAPVIGSSEGVTDDSLVVIDFHVLDGAAPGSSPISLVPRNSLGSTNLVSANPPDNQYTLTLTSGSANVLPASSATNLGYFTAVNPLTITGNLGIGTMLLLPDGSVMAESGMDHDSNKWYLLTPDSSGNYADGTWSQLASSDIGRLFFGSVVMQNGDVLVLGGEDSNIGTEPIVSVVGTAGGPITVTTGTPLPTNLTSGFVTLSEVSGFPSNPLFNNEHNSINAGFNFTVTGTNKFTLNGTDGIVGTSDPETGKFEVSPVSIVGTAAGPITVTTGIPLPTDLTSGSVTLASVTGFPTNPLFNNDGNTINAQFDFTVTGPNTFTLDGTNGIVGMSDPNTGTFSVSDSNTGEIFTPPTPANPMGSWHNITSFPQNNFGDASLELMSDGTVLAAGGDGEAYSYAPALDPILNPALPADSNPWSIVATLPSGLTNAETTWTKLPDGSILSYHIGNPPQTAGQLVTQQVITSAIGTASTPITITTANPIPTALTTGADVTIVGVAGFAGANGSFTITVTGTNTFTLNGTIGTVGSGAASTGSWGSWVPTENVPVPLGATGGAGLVQEMGAAFLLPEGRVFQIGANGNTALYSPPALAGNSTGIWAAGPVIPDGEGATDAPGAMMTNGDVLFAVSPYMTYGGPSGTFNRPTTIDEYDPTTNTITVVPLNNSSGNPISDLVSRLGNQSVFSSRMLDLPNGQVLFTDSASQAYVYTPNAAPNGVITPLATWRPVIQNITANSDGSFTLTGTQINGLSEGANYGDDAQMATNYPIVKITTLSQTLYATTFNWSSAGVQTGSTPETVQFTLPADLTLNQVTSVAVIANGIASAPQSPVMLGNTDESVTIQVDPGDSASVQVLVTNTSTVVATYPNNSLNTIIILGDSNDNTVTVDEANGVVKTVISFDGGGSPGAPGDQMIVLGTSGNDSLDLTPTGSASARMTFDGSPEYSFSNINQFTFDAGAGNDTMTIDSSNSLLDLPDGIQFNGDTGFDELDLTQTGDTTQSSDVYTVGPNNGEGSDVITGPSGTQTVYFQNLAPVLDTVPAARLTVNATPADNVINYGPGVVDPVNDSRVTIDNFEAIEFSNKTNLVINGEAGGDLINLDNPDVPAGLTGTITVNGGAPTASDTLIVNGTTGADSIAYTPDAIAPGNGMVTVAPMAPAAALPSVAFTGIGNLNINGEGGDDNLVLDDVVGFNTVTLTPGAAVDSGSVTVTNGAAGPSSATPLSFSNLGRTGSFTVDNSIVANPDTLVYNGTVTNDTFLVSEIGGSGRISLIAAAGLFIPVNTTRLGVMGLILNGISGQDTFDTTAPVPFTSIALEASTPEPSVANLTGNDSTPVLSTLGGTSTTFTGGGLGDVTLTGVGVVNLTNGTGNVALTGTTAQPANIVVTPTGEDSATIQDNNLAPMVFLTTGTGGTLTVGGNGTVTVNGTNVASVLMSVSGTGAPPNSTNVVVNNNGVEQLPVAVTVGTASLVLKAGLGDGDAFLVDSITAAVTVPITIVGGGSGTGDTLTLSGGTATGDIYSPGAIPGTGNSTLTFPGLVTETVTFSNLTPVFDSVAGPLTVSGTSANNMINYQEGDSSAGVPSTDWGQVSVDASEPINFTNKTGLGIFGDGGDDTITVNNANTPTGLAGGIIAVSAGPGDSTLNVNANHAPFTSADISSTTVTAIPAAIPVQIDYVAITNVHIIDSTDALTGKAATITAIAGVPLNNVVVASFQFTDPQPPAFVGSPGDFLAMIDWADPSPNLTAGTIVELAPAGGVVTFDVLGTHTFATQSAAAGYPVGVTIHDTGSSRSFTPPGGVPVTITANSGAATVVSPIVSTANVASAPLTATGPPTNQVEGIASTSIVATFVDPNPGASVANYPSGSISINWGDGTAILGTSPPIIVTQVGTQPNGVVFEVSAPHTYAEEGNDTAVVEITRSTIVSGIPTPGSSAVAVSSEIVADAPLTATPTQPTVDTDEAVVYPIPEFGTPLVTGDVAEFTDANPTALIIDFSATIDWGDGTPQSAGTINQPMGVGTPFFVTGSHTYATSGVDGGVGMYPISVYVSDVGESKLTVVNPAKITDNPIAVTGGLNPASDTGKNNIDDITNATRPNFYGTVMATLPNGTSTPDPYAHVTLYANGVAVGTTQADSSGIWSITSNPLPQGTFAITAGATDQFGQTVSR